MVGIVIVTYNSKSFIDDCLKSLYKSTYKKYKVILVDNNSSDETVTYVKKKYPKVSIFALKKNTGFASGNNFGIKKAIKAGCKYVFLVNPDTITDKYCLENLMVKATNQAILQPLVLIHNGKKMTKLINSYGVVLNYLGFSYCGNYRKNMSTITKDRDIAVAVGTAMLIPYTVIKKIGLFDDEFFMYHEDVDLSWRARIAGFNIQLISTAKVWHKYEFSRNKNKFFYAERNRFLFLYKNCSIKYLLLISPAFILTEIAVLFYSLISGWFLLKIKSYVSVIRLIGKETKYRKKNLKNISQTEKNLKKFISTEISFSEVKNSLFIPYSFVLKLYWYLINRFI